MNPHLYIAPLLIAFIGFRKPPPHTHTLISLDMHNNHNVTEWYICNI